MSAPNSLQVLCKTCKISATCPKRGSSPLYADGNRKMMTCVVVGGYGRDPVDPSILSEESKSSSERDGRFLSIVEVPAFDKDSGKYYFEVVKVFHEPIVHPREKVSHKMDVGVELSHSIEKPRRRRS
jgi:hypothetical protein